MVEWAILLDSVLKSHIGADRSHKEVALVQWTIDFSGFALLLDLLQRLLQNKLQFVLFLHLLRLSDLGLSFFVVPLVMVLFLFFHICCLRSHIVVLQFLLLNLLNLRLYRTLLDRCILLMILRQMEVIILIIDVVERFIFIVWVISFGSDLLLVLMRWVNRVLNTMVFFTIFSDRMTTIWIFLIHSSHTLGGLLKLGDAASQWSISFLVVLLVLLSVSFLDIIWRLVLLRVSIQIVFGQLVGTKIATLLILIWHIGLRRYLIKPVTRAVLSFPFRRGLLLLLDIFQIVDLLECLGLLKGLDDFFLPINNIWPKSIDLILFEAFPELG